VHDNQRAGVHVGGSVTGVIVTHNDARENNLSGTGCNLFDTSTGSNGGNLWAFNHGTYSGTDACAP
jgi:hypothetical protein